MHLRVRVFPGAACLVSRLMILLSGGVLVLTALRRSLRRRILRCTDKRSITLTKNGDPPSRIDQKLNSSMSFHPLDDVHHDLSRLDAH